MKSNSLGFYCLFLLLPFFISSCNTDDLPKIEEVYKGFIQVQGNSGDLQMTKPQPLYLNSNGSTISQILYDTDLYVEKISMKTRFEVTNDSSELVISTGKSFGFLRITGNLIETYKLDDKYKNVIQNEFFSLPVSLKPGFYYEIGFDKNQNAVRFYLRQDKDTLFAKTYIKSIDIQQCTMWGKPFFNLEKGSIVVYNSTLSMPYENTSVSISGDSFVEGHYLIYNGSLLTARWVTVFQHALGENRCFIDAKGGEPVSDAFLERLRVENGWYLSRYVILALGVNNYPDINEYLKMMPQVIEHIKSRKQIPVLVTVTPRNNFDYAETGAVINDWIKQSGERYIDLHKAVTKPDNPGEWIDGYVMPDNTHPSVKGYNAMSEQIKKDCGDILSP